MGEVKHTSPFSPFLTISLCRAGHYLSNPVFSISCHVFSKLECLHVSLWYGMVWCLFIQHQCTLYIAQITQDAEKGNARSVVLICSISLYVVPRDFAPLTHLFQNLGVLRHTKYLKAALHITNVSLGTIEV